MKLIITGVILLGSLSCYANTANNLIRSCLKSNTSSTKSIEADRYSSDDYILSVKCTGEQAQSLYEELTKKKYDLVTDEYISVGNHSVSRVFIGEREFGLDSNQVSKCLRLIDRNGEQARKPSYLCYINLDLNTKIIKKVEANFTENY